MKNAKKIFLLVVQGVLGLFISATGLLLLYIARLMTLGIGLVFIPLFVGLMSFVFGLFLLILSCQGQLTFLVYQEYANVKKRGDI